MPSAPEIEQVGEEAVSAFTPRLISHSRLDRVLTALRVDLVTVFECNVPQWSRFGGGGSCRDEVR
jgi:hypothetical protein